MSNQIETIKSLLEEMMEKMSIKADIEILENNESVQFVIKTEESGILIGENGQNFIALNHVIKRIIDKQFKNDEKFYFSIDVNDYQLKKIEELKNLARMTAQRVRYFKKEIAMEPMTSYERRIIHAILTEYPDIITESVGEGYDRKVVIKPYLE
ncbi:MAG: R3H domain-containing nucleic acid-binding protein [Patescibacteria group bacterium]